MTCGYYTCPEGSLSIGEAPQFLNKEGQERVDRVEAYHYQELGNKYSVEVLSPGFGNHI